MMCSMKRILCVPPNIPLIDHAATLLDEAEQEITELKQQLEEANAYIEKLKNTIVNLGFDGVSILKEREKEK